MLQLRGQIYSSYFSSTLFSSVVIAHKRIPVRFHRITAAFGKGFSRFKIAALVPLRELLGDFLDYTNFIEARKSSQFKYHKRKLLKNVENKHQCT
jgi:hypothetical protein